MIVQFSQCSIIYDLEYVLNKNLLQISTFSSPVSYSLPQSTADEAKAGEMLSSCPINLSPLKSPNNFVPEHRLEVINQVLFSKRHHKLMLNILPVFQSIAIIILVELNLSHL